MQNKEFYFVDQCNEGSILHPHNKMNDRSLNYHIETLHLDKSEGNFIFCFSKIYSITVYLSAV